MEAIHLHKVVEKDGELLLTDLPLKKGQSVKMILVAQSPMHSPHVPLTARQLLQSDLVGLWHDREDIQDSAMYARELREQAYRRWE